MKLPKKLYLLSLFMLKVKLLVGFALGFIRFT
jgi:hypothetical protein